MPCTLEMGKEIINKRITRKNLGGNTKCRNAPKRNRVCFPRGGIILWERGINFLKSDIRNKSIVCVVTAYHKQYLNI